MQTFFYNKTSFLELKEKVPITKENAEKINMNWNIFSLPKYCNWYLLNEQYYYFKRLPNIKLLNNLILSRIVKKYYKLQVAEFKLARVNDEVGLAAINFREQQKKYFEADQEHFPSFNPIITFQYLKTFFQDIENYYHLVNDLTNLMSFHIYSGLCDLCSVNLLFKEEKDGFSLAPVFDLDDAYEAKISFGTYEYYSYICDLKIPSNTFTEFITCFPSFQCALQIQDDIDMNKVLTEVEEENNIDINELLKDYYKRRDEEKKDFIRSLKL